MGEPTPVVALHGATVDLERRTAERGGVRVELSVREVDLLAWFLAHPVRPVDRRTLLREVWGYRGGAPTRVVDMTVRRLREKIEAEPSEPTHLLTVRGVGYRFEPPAQPVRAPTPALIGRDDVLRRIREALRGPAPRVTVWGLPGLGKSAVLARLAAELPALTVIRGAALRDAGELRAAIAAAGSAGVLALDDVDHLLDPLAELLADPDGLERRPTLIASRSPLGVHGEVDVQLGPLAPDAARALYHASLDRRAAAADDADRHAAEICQLLDGVPLAIVLAAAQRSLGSADAVLGYVRHTPLAMEAELRTLPERHRHLGRALGAALADLAPWELRALAQLAVFEGPFRVDAAEAVIDVSDDDEAPPPWAVLRRLLRRGLVSPQPSARDGARDAASFALLPLVGRMVAERLDPAARAHAERRHGAYHASLESDAALAAIDDLLAATERAVHAGEARIAAGCLRALASMGDPSDPQRATRWSTARSRWDRVRGRLGDAYRAIAPGIATCRASGDDGALAHALHQLALLQNVRGELAESRRSLDEASACAARAGLTALRAQIHTLAAVGAMEVGDDARAFAEVHAARVHLRAIGGDPGIEAELDVVEGLCALNARRTDDARALILAADRWFEAAGNRMRRAWSQNNLGEIARHADRLDDAEQHYRRARELFAESGVDEVVAECNLVLCALARGDLGAANDLVSDTLPRALRHGRSVRIAMLRLARAAIRAPTDLAGATEDLGEAGALLEASGFVHEELAGIADLGASRSPALAAAFRALAARQRTRTGG